MSDPTRPTLPEATPHRGPDEGRVQVVALIDAKPGREAALRRELEALIEPTRAEEGCVVYDLHQALDNPGSFVFYEIWESAGHLERHSRSAHLARFRERGAELWQAPPRVVRLRRIA